MSWWLTAVFWAACLAAGVGGRLLSGRSDRFALWWWAGLAVVEAALAAAGFVRGYWLEGSVLAVVALWCGWHWRVRWREWRRPTWWKPLRGRTRSGTRAQMDQARDQAPKN